MTERSVLYAYWCGWDGETGSDCWVIGPDDAEEVYLLTFSEERMNRAARLLRWRGWTVVADKPPSLQAQEAMRERQLLQMAGLRSH
jgi:hypothetical protein